GGGVGTAEPSRGGGFAIARPSCRSDASAKTRTWRCTPGAGSAVRSCSPQAVAGWGPAGRRATVHGGESVSASDTTKIDVQERGADRQTSERRLFIQLSVFGGCLDAKPLLRALES